MQANTATATSPQEIINVLRKLQTLDDEAREIRNRRTERLDHLERLRKVIAHMQREIDDKRGKLTEAESWYRTKSGELDTDKERLVKSKSKLSGVTRSREYVAVNKELDIIRKNITTKEDDVAKLVVAIDEFRAAIAKEEVKFADWRTEADQAERDNQASLDTMDAKIGEVNVRRSAVAAQVDPAIVKRYQRIGAARDGKGVVEMVNDSCSGCNMALQPRFAEMVLRATSLVQCPHCGRYLFGDSALPSSAQA
ncbi:MAG: hypothetical protein EXR77_02315 [Myxococcales bacterium]|nr:hypothetical protein [Myxococcales bacterium]